MFLNLRHLYKHIVLFCRNIFFSLLADSFHILPSNNLQIETNITTSQIPTIIHCLGKIASKHGEETYPLHSNAFRWEYTFDLKGTWNETMIFSKVVFTMRYTKTNNCPHFFAIKVYVFLEGHKKLQNLHRLFDNYLVCVKSIMKIL